MAKQMHHRAAVSHNNAWKASCLIAEALNDGPGFRAFLSDECDLDFVSRPLPDTSLDVDTFRLEYLKAEYASKYKFCIPGVDRKQNAINKFLDAELACRSSNSRFTGWDSRASVPFPVFMRAKRLIHGLLGEFNIDELPSRCGFSSGASTSLPRRRASLQNKWALSSHVTATALPYAIAFQRYAGEVVGNRSFEVVDGNRVTTVDKNAKTDRVIAIEPDWNMFFQKGVGTMLRSRLQRVGLLHKDAQASNRRAACEGSETNRLATIDLSAASDSISIALVAALLPPSWVKVLLDFRSPGGWVDGKVIAYEKISSMGNGYTFELETLLFWALTKAVVGDSRVWVYGDDIICDSSKSQSVLDVLALAGFQPNPEKTHVDGPFRESCGGHYLNGRHVTPFYLRRQDLTSLDRVELSNQILVWSTYDRFAPEDLLSDAWRYLSHRIPRKHYGCPPYGGTLWTPWDQARPTYEPSLQSFKIFPLERKQRSCPSNQRGGLMASLWVDSTYDTHHSEAVAAAGWAFDPSDVRADLNFSKVPKNLEKVVSGKPVYICRHGWPDVPSLLH